MKPTPSRTSPVFVERIWGALSLAPLFDDARVSVHPIGEVWLTGEECRFDSGPLTGRLLGEVWPQLPAEWTGASLRHLPRIPLLVKFIFPNDKLSVQVHPDDDYAREHEIERGGVGKTEMWYTIAAKPGAKLFLGLEPSTTSESFRDAIDEGTVERHMKSLPVHAGDLFFVPAGTAHTIGSGMVLCEVQQHSDITYRIHDYNRLQADGTPRQLHIRQALDVLRFGVELGGRIDSITVRAGNLEKTYLVACRYFAAERWDFSRPVPAATSRERFELLIFLSGTGHLQWLGGSAPYDKAQAWFLPAALGSYTLRPQTPTRLLRTYVPDLQEFRNELAAKGISEPVLRRLVHS